MANTQLAAGKRGHGDSQGVSTTSSATRSRVWLHAAHLKLHPQGQLTSPMLGSKAIRKERINFRSELGGTEVDDEGREGRQYVLGTINGLCEASATLCRILEKRAIQAEFEEKQRDDPKNWTAFRQRIEAFESIKEIRNEPPYQIPEAVVRSIIAEIDGVKPEDVTWKRIAFEIAGLGGPK